MYYRSEILTTAKGQQADLADFEPSTGFYAKKYTIVAVTVLGLAVWAFVRPLDVIVFVLNSHKHYLARHEAFLSIYLNGLILLVSLISTALAVIGSLHQNYYCFKYYFEFCLVYEFLWFLSIIAWPVNILWFLVHSVWLFLVYRFLKELEALDPNKGGLRFYF